MVHKCQLKLVVLRMVLCKQIVLLSTPEWHLECKALSQK